jgi:hypothetical protein
MRGMFSLAFVSYLKTSLLLSENQYAFNKMVYRQIRNLFCKQTFQSFIWKSICTNAPAPTLACAVSLFPPCTHSHTHTQTRMCTHTHTHTHSLD